MNTDKLILEALESAHSEGVGMHILGQIEARLFNELNKARRITRAASILPLLGADVAAVRMNCHKSTVYRLAEKHAEMAREKVA